MPPSHLCLSILMATAASAVAQSPATQLTNVSRPAAKDFQVGGKFEIVVTAEANQPVSVRTIMQGRTDWGPVAGWTDSSGRWSATGQFGKSDFGSWREFWTVGGKIANPVIDFWVGAPCLRGAQGFAYATGLAMGTSCDTPDGHQSFVTPSALRTAEPSPDQIAPP